MTDDDVPLPADDMTRRLRDLATSEVVPNREQLDRLRARIAVTVPAVVATPDAPPSPPASPGLPAAPLGGAKLLLVTYGLVVGAVVGAAAMHAIDTRAPSVASVASAPLSAAPQHDPAPPVAASATPILTAPEDAGAHVVAPRASAASSMNAERLLVDEARSAYARGESDEALRVLARHATTYSNGSLAEEREALAIRILADSGRADEARKRGERFRARYPRSLMLPAVEAALEALP